MGEKKIVLFLVEGTSDIDALENNLEEIYEKYNIEFKALRCDITADESSTCTNIEKILIEKIDEFLNKHSEVTDKDILSVVQIVDLDGAGIPCEKIIQSKHKKTTYTEELIYAKNRERLVARNMRKRNILSSLKNKKMIGKNDKNKEENYKLDYHIYYFSRNLEHALYNLDGEYSKEEKETLAIEFADKFEGREEEFIEYLRKPEIMISGSYQDTWNYILSELHSLQRGSNLHLLFETIPFK